jgi:hypothetical protein
MVVTIPLKGSLSKVYQHSFTDGFRTIQITDATPISTKCRELLLLLPPLIKYRFTWPEEGVPAADLRENRKRIPSLARQHLGPP